MIQARAFCDRHIDSAYQVPCAACDQLTAEWRLLAPTVCPRHPMSLLPCERCSDAA